LRLFSRWDAVTVWRRIADHLTIDASRLTVTTGSVARCARHVVVDQVVAIIVGVVAAFDDARVDVLVGVVAVDRRRIARATGGVSVAVEIEPLVDVAVTVLIDTVTGLDRTGMYVVECSQYTTSALTYLPKVTHDARARIVRDTLPSSAVLADRACHSLATCPGVDADIVVANEPNGTPIWTGIPFADGAVPAVKKRQRNEEAPNHEGGDPLTHDENSHSFIRLASSDRLGQGTFQVNGAVPSRDPRHLPRVDSPSCCYRFEEETTCPVSWSVVFDQR
jgi:hypothetical protein